MIVIEQQLHGYRHGHELLSSSLQLPARDQDLVDRLSDVAGPLGPGERFASYLTCYPLLSGTHYVVARTWQDLLAPRAGCVRTRSMLVPMAGWLEIQDPSRIAAAATEAGYVKQAERLTLDPASSEPLPPVENGGVELLEALFLEDRVPVAVFGAAAPELMALRLLTAVWPARRRHFTVSTFCNSPRTIARKSFDLVFAPVEARSRFSDWTGRRIDGRKSAAPRHRWTGEIVDRIFRSPRPTLLGLDALGEMVGDEEGTENALRVSLLWEELANKVASEPHAALGLLDIANSRAGKRTELVRTLGPALSEAARTATRTMPPTEAWRFLKVLIGKLGGVRPKLSAARAIRVSTMALAQANPMAAVEALHALLKDDQLFLIGGLGAGLASAEPFEPVAQMLRELDSGGLLKLALYAPEMAPALLKEDVGLDAKLASDLDGVGQDDLLSARHRLGRYLVADRHAEIFRPLLVDMDGERLVSEASRLHSANGLEQQALNRVIIEAARRTEGVAALRDAVASYEATPAVVRMLRDLVAPNQDDVRWLVMTPHLKAELRRSLLSDLLESASKDEMRSMFSDGGVLREALAMIGAVGTAAAKTLAKVVEDVPMEADVFIDLVQRLLPHLGGRRAAELAARGLEIGLGREFRVSRDESISLLLESAGKELNGGRAYRVALAPSVPFHLASRNLTLFDRAKPAVRARLLKDPEALANAIIARHVLDLTQEAAEAAARLLWDSEAVEHKGFVRASATLLPFAMRERRQSASALIAAAFPPVYRELRRERLPDFMAFVFAFLDWDRCKFARRDLSERFLRSEWRGADVALAAARSGDAEGIFREMAHHDGGRSALARIERESSAIPDPWRQQVLRGIKECGSGGGSLFGLPFDL